MSLVNSSPAAENDSDLPMSTHTFVLGADICVAQRDTHTHEYSGHRTRESAVQVEPFLAKVTQPRSRRYLAAWARRALFSGAGGDH